MEKSVGVRLGFASCSLFFLLSCGGGGSTSDAVDPQPVNSAPTDITLSNASVEENAVAAEIGSLQTTDANAGDTFTYTLSGSSASRVIPSRWATAFPPILNRKVFTSSPSPPEIPPAPRFLKTFK